MNHLENSRAESALKRVLQPECDAAVVAYSLDNGDICVVNMGDTKARKLIYKTIVSVMGHALDEYRCPVRFVGGTKMKEEEAKS